MQESEYPVGERQSPEKVTPLDNVPDSELADALALLVFMRGLGRPWYVAIGSYQEILTFHLWCSGLVALRRGSVAVRVEPVRLLRRASR